MGMLIVNVSWLTEKNDWLILERWVEGKGQGMAAVYIAWISFEINRWLTNNFESGWDYTSLGMLWQF
jgi:hypothetical protein